MFQKGDHMVVLAALIIFAVVGGIFVIIFAEIKMISAEEWERIT